MTEAIVHVSLSITVEEYQKLYAGTAKSVFATSLDGRRIRFPAAILRSYVTREGVRGCFAIYFDHDNRFKKIVKIG
ncbi:DUF2835 domain-containing protein [Teredinibacter purpureus]|uniref:DUF2835 domain-containing protein n=1 Tax=Teredinibacter purpureus TaxID=2731756 RepID=UPI0005F885ED|nr:DUF2835 domain-containing protein [Teredinibacter purpureus]